jgi:hypothetical protein
MSTAGVRVERISGMSSIPGMLVTGLRTVAKTEIALSTSATTRGTMIIMALIMTSPPDVVLRLEIVTQEESSLSLPI